MGTKANPGRYDCYEKAEPDEPLFVLLARDRHAPGLVWLWSVLRELDADEAKAHEARECVIAMIEWAAAHGRPVAGIAQSVLAGVLEMIRTINHFVGEDARNEMTGPDDVRRFLCATRLGHTPTHDTEVEGLKAELARSEGERDEACRVAAQRAGADPELRDLLLYEFGTTETELLRDQIADWRERLKALTLEVVQLRQSQTS